MSQSSGSKEWYQKQDFQRFVGAGVGFVGLGAVAFISAPVAIPAIGIGLGAVGVSALTSTAIGFGLVGVSAVVGGVVGGFSAPDIYDVIVDLFKKEEEGGGQNSPKPSYTPRRDPDPKSRPDDNGRDPRDDPNRDGYRPPNQDSTLPQAPQSAQYPALKMEER